MDEGTDAQAEESKFGPWNPGLGSDLPRHLLPLSTIFRAENVFTSVEHAHEYRDFTGLELQELVVFRPERLALHELLIRTTADLSVPAGLRVEDLGINFREMVDRVFSHYVAAQMPQLVAAYDRIKQSLRECIEDELSRTLFQSASASAEPARPAGILARLGLAGLFARKKPAPRIEADWEREERVRREWTHRAHHDSSPLRQAAFRALVRAVSAMRIKHGRMWADRAFLASLATGMACNDYGSEAIGNLIDPHLQRAADSEGYVLLPNAEQSVVLNTKGASASGKSTLRPLQKKLVEKIGVDWSDFALISPDIWRKYLLDYASLGEAFKYAGSLTGIELEIIDRKLDRYMARKAERGEMTHLLIDRFRFDSFALDSDQAGSNLLTRFGYLIYMFFMITPPHETVERAWRRGLEFGRFKSVDDLLAHNVEAFSGMPEMFFTWALRTNKSVHYEFLDNSVPLGETPLTVAFGWNGAMNVLDVKGLLDIDRYRKINVHAENAEAVYPGGDAMAPENNTLFLLQCVRRLPNVNFVHRPTGQIYARFESGNLVWTDPEVLDRALEDPETRSGILAVSPDVRDGVRHEGPVPPRQQEVLEAARFHTLGSWSGK